MYKLKQNIPPTSFYQIISSSRSTIFKSYLTTQLFSNYDSYQQTTNIYR